MSASLLIGNDIVYLKAARLGGKDQHQAFLNKILSAEEQQILRTSDSPALTLWKFWSAKEAAYKILKKLEPQMVFSPTNLHVQESGIVKTPVADLKVSWTYDSEYLHCVAVPTNQACTPLIAVEQQSAVIQNQKTVLSAPEAASAKSEASIAVRLLAKKLLTQAGYPNAEIVRMRISEYDWGPPVVWPHGHGKNTPGPQIDISLSHDGPWVAAAITFIAPESL